MKTFFVCFFTIHIIKSIYIKFFKQLRDELQFGLTHKKRKLPSKLMEKLQKKIIKSPKTIQIKNYFITNIYGIQYVAYKQ